LGVASSTAKVNLIHLIILSIPILAESFPTVLCPLELAVRSKERGKVCVAGFDLQLLGE
jgi:hypothetical protein